MRASPQADTAAGASTSFQVGAPAFHDNAPTTRRYKKAHTSCLLRLSPTTFSINSCSHDNLTFLNLRFVFGLSSSGQLFHCKSHIRSREALLIRIGRAPAFNPSRTLSFYRITTTNFLPRIERVDRRQDDALLHVGTLFLRLSCWVPERRLTAAGVHDLDD